MKEESAIRWEPVDGVDRPCADFSFEYRAPHLLIVRMHYSRAVGNVPRDLEIRFEGVLAMRWEEEAIGLNPLPENLPKCSNSTWVFPLLKIDNSRWVAENTELNPTLLENRDHFALVTMNDLGQIIAQSNPVVSWIDGDNAV